VSRYTLVATLGFAVANVAACGEFESCHADPVSFSLAEPGAEVRFVATLRSERRGNGRARLKGTFDWTPEPSQPMAFALTGGTLAGVDTVPRTFTAALAVEEEGRKRLVRRTFRLQRLDDAAGVVVTGEALVDGGAIEGCQVSLELEGN
jgi:hypothetical protein